MPSATNPGTPPPLSASRILVQSLAVMGSNAGALAVIWLFLLFYQALISVTMAITYVTLRRKAGARPEGRPRRRERLTGCSRRAESAR